jgi:ATP-dependent Clp protease ATP-binding subunit ClpA
LLESLLNHPRFASPSLINTTRNSRPALFASPPSPVETCPIHQWFGTEHLLLGLLRDSEGVGGRVLRRLGVDLDEARAAVAYWARGVPAPMAPRDATPETEPIGLAQRAKVALELAVANAQRQSPGLAQQEHLLLALLHGQEDTAPGRGVASAILQGFGVTEEHVRAGMSQVLEEVQEEVTQDHPYRLADSGKWDEATQSIAQWREKRRQGRRYSLVLPEGLFEQVERLAQRHDTTVVELLRRFTRLGLMAMELQERRDAALIIREGDTERQILFL